MKYRLLFGAFLTLSLSALPGLDETAVVADFSFQDRPDPVHDVAGTISGTCYEGLSAVSPTYGEFDGMAGVTFSGTGGLVFPSSGLRYSETALGIYLRIWVEELPRSSVSVAAQQGKFYLDVDPEGYVSARIAGVPEPVLINSRESKLKLLPNAWNDVVLSFDQGQVELFINNQIAASLGTSSTLAGSANPLSLGGLLAKPGDLESTPDNHWRNVFTGGIQRFVLTRVPLRPGDLPPAAP